MSKMSQDRRKSTDEQARPHVHAPPTVLHNSVFSMTTVDHSQLARGTPIADLAALLHFILYTATILPDFVEFHHVQRWCMKM